MERNLNIRTKEVVQSSVVAVFEGLSAHVSPLVDRKYLESRLGLTLEIVQGRNDRGDVLILRVPKRRLEILFTPDRIEAKSLDDIHEVVSGQLADAVDVAASIFPEVNWKLFGYNFVYAVDATRLAIDVIASQLIDKKALSETIRYPVLGSAASLWIDVGKSVLWLRIDPKGGDRTAERIWVNANFTEELGGKLPGKDAMAAAFLSNHEVLTSILKGMGIW